MQKTELDFFVNSLSKVIVALKKRQYIKKSNQDVIFVFIFGLDIFFLTSHITKEKAFSQVVHFPCLRFKLTLFG